MTIEENIQSSNKADKCWANIGSVKKKRLKNSTLKQKVFPSK